MSGARKMPEGRAEMLARLGDGRLYDLLVVGGGITGAGIALEAARTGVSALLVEAGDFASGTSSRSSKLVHGGLRYLKQGRFMLTREALRERTALLEGAPGLVEPLRFILPIRRGERPGKSVYGAGLALYDFLAGVKSRTWLDAGAVRARMPDIRSDDLAGGWEYLDAQTDDARLVLRVVQEARASGVVAVNYCRVEDFLRDSDGNVRGAALRDVVTNEVLPVRAKCAVNAAGAWSDRLRRLIGGTAKIRPLRGSHLLFPQAKLPATEALAFAHPQDGRAVFIVPWEGAVFVGATDLDHSDDLDNEPAITREEADYLMSAVAEEFPALHLKAEDALSSWSGVRPIVSSGKSLKPSQESREHFIIEESGLITVCGGKLTTFHVMAHEVLHHAEDYLPLLKHAAPGATFTAKAPPPRPEEWPEALHRRMLGRYGDRLSALIEGAAPGELSLIPETQTPWAELRHACRHESVVHLDDLLLRRTRLGLLLPRGGEDLLPAVETIIRQELGWDEARWRAEADRYRDIIRRSYSVPEGAQ